MIIVRDISYSATYYVSTVVPRLKCGLSTPYHYDRVATSIAAGYMLIAACYCSSTGTSS